MYCSIDKIDLAARVDGHPVAIQTDHRSAGEIEAEPELSGLYAMARVLNARSHLADDGHPGAAVHYIVADEPPPLLRDALRAVGAVVQRPGGVPVGDAAGPDEDIGEIADRCFAALARRAATRVGTRDLAMALRMLEDQTLADPPARTDERRYWDRVLELAALTGELLRAKYPAAGRWVQTDRAVVPFGFQLATSDSGGSTVMFPTNRAQRVIEDGADESLFKLLLAAEETMQRPPDATTGRLMPSLRSRQDVELDEVVWKTLLAEGAPEDLPIVVCGIDGENTFGMIRREALARPPEHAMAESLANLATEDVEVEEAVAGELVIAVVSGSFYAAEKLLDEPFMQQLHRELGSPMLAAAVPTRGLLVVTSAQRSAGELARFGALVRARHDDAGGRAISPAVLLVSGGRVVGYVKETVPERPDTAPIRADTTPEPAARVGFLRRLLGRK